VGIVELGGPGVAAVLGEEAVVDVEGDEAGPGQVRGRLGQARLVAEHQRAPVEQDNRWPWGRTLRREHDVEHQGLAISLAVDHVGRVGDSRR
jgi:hypothetical protein